VSTTLKKEGQNVQSSLLSSELQMPNLVIVDYKKKLYRMLIHTFPNNATLATLEHLKSKLNPGLCIEPS